MIYAFHANKTLPAIHVKLTVRSQITISLEEMNVITFVLRLTRQLFVF